jgi:hypothetical protein
MLEQVEQTNETDEATKGTRTIQPCSTVPQWEAFDEAAFLSTASTMEKMAVVRGLEVFIQSRNDKASLSNAILEGFAETANGSLTGTLAEKKAAILTAATDRAYYEAKLQRDLEMANEAETCQTRIIESI